MQLVFGLRQLDTDATDPGGRTGGGYSEQDRLPTEIGAHHDLREDAQSLFEQFPVRNAEVVARPLAPPADTGGALRPKHPVGGYLPPGAPAAP